MFVYAAGGYYQPGKDLAALRDEMRGYLDRGYTVVKMKIGGAPSTKTSAGSRRCSPRSGSRRSLAVDANGRFDLPDRHRLCRSCCAPIRCSGTRRRAIRSTTRCRPRWPQFYPGPMATGENLFSHQDARNLLRYGGMRPDRDWLQFDCALSYGLCEYLRTLADARGERLVAAALHPAWRAPDVAQHRGRPGLGRQRELPRPLPALRRLPGRRRVEDGYVVLPELPGIGFEGKADLIQVMRELAE